MVKRKTKYDDDNNLTLPHPTVERAVNFSPSMLTCSYNSKTAVVISPNIYGIKILSAFQLSQVSESLRFFQILNFYQSLLSEIF